MIDRRAEGVSDQFPPAPAPECLRIVDLGANDPPSDAAVIVVCRATIPGIRLAEAVLARLSDPVALAIVGPRRWPAALSASAGSRVRLLRGQQRIVAVPWDRRFAVSGLTADPLPKRLVNAGSRLLVIAYPTDAPDLASSQNLGGLR